MITGAQLFVFTLLLHGTMLATTRGRPRVSTEPINAPIDAPIDAPRCTQRCTERCTRVHQMMHMASSSNAEGAGRSTSFGQHRPSTAVDRFGVWLSSIAVRRGARFAEQRVADFGCGFDANFVRSQLDVVRSALLVDVAIAEDLKQHPKVTALEGDLAGSSFPRFRARRWT